MSLALVLVVISIGLLLAYAVDLSSGASLQSILGLGMQGGLILGGPALVLPIIATFISKNKPDKTIPILVIICGILIIIGGIAMAVNYAPILASQPPIQDLDLAEEKSYDPMLFEIGSLFSIGGLQIMLAFKRLKIISSSTFGV
ncbi:MAG: hypothetical protein FJ354_02910 [Thaumarchaeota archaeon]|nr:hypothetical protein [Nitrososphaerota archaeon]